MRMDEQKDKEFYREKIKELVEKIEDIWILEQILRFIKNMIKEGG